MAYNTKKIGDALQELIKEYQLNHKLNEVKLVNLWPIVVGDLINRHTSKIWVSGETMYVRINSATLKHELSLSKSIVIQNINKEMGMDVIKELNIG